MAGTEVHKSNRSRKNRKHNRNRKKCERYAAEHRRIRNNPARKQREKECTPHFRH